ncbi:MAG: trypsin-like serine protease [Bauldia sp.]|nr:trypsin-like serine protease [Bauldia sp.]
MTARFHTVAMAAILVAVAAPAGAQSPDPETIEFTKPAGGERASGWTRPVMAAAAEDVLPSVDPEAVRAAGQGLRGNRPAGEPGSTAEKDLAPAGGERMSGDVRDRPLYWAGKIFFRKPDGGYVCSGQFISENVVLTAAHCVRDSDTGEWYDDVVFALQYENGKYAELYDTECSATLAGWVSKDESKYNYDFATILVEGSSQTGYFGTAWNWEGQYADVTKIGYPVSIRDGQVIQIERGPIELKDGIVALKHGNPKNQGGSSGGAWIGGFNDTPGSEEGNRVISLQSFHYDGLDGVGFGPYLTESFRKLWLFTENGCE